MNQNAWHKKTSAKIVSIPNLRTAIRENDGFSIGLVGFSGSFAEDDQSGAERMTRRILELKLSEVVQSKIPKSVYLISGATNLGVPRVGYSIAKRLGCVNVGVTADIAAKYSIAELDYLSVVGTKFGDESESFVSLLDELWVLGGGQQSLTECKLASESNVPITVMQGIGGIADELNFDMIEAEYVNISQYIMENS